jgi:hypothetical protein
MVSQRIIRENGMSNARKFHSIAALCGDGLRPELQALFKRLAVDQSSELFVRSDGMSQSGPNPISDTAAASGSIPAEPADRSCEPRVFANPPAAKIAARLENGSCTLVLGGLTDDMAFTGIEIFARRRSRA